MPNDLRQLVKVVAKRDRAAKQRDAAQAEVRRIVAGMRGGPVLARDIAAVVGVERQTVRAWWASGEPC